METTSARPVNVWTLVRTRLLWRWSPLVAIAIVAAVGMLKASPEPEVYDVLAAAFVTVLILALWPLFELLLLIHEFGHLLAFWLFRPRGTHPPFIVLGISKTTPEYAPLFHLWKTEVRLGCGLLGWLEPPSMETESDGFIRFVAISGHLFGSAGGGLAFFALSAAPSMEPGFVAWLVELAQLFALIPCGLLCVEAAGGGWFVAGSDIRVLVFGKSEYLRFLELRKAKEARTRAHL